MKRLCLISAFFPPAGGPIVQRVYKHTKFLKEFGWDAFVITRRKVYFYAFDHTLLDEIPKELKIFRTFSLDYGFLKSMFKKGKEHIQVDRRWDPKSIKRISIGNLIRLFLLIPDGLIGWIPFAFWRAFRLRKEVDAYYLRMPPWSTGYLAPLLKIFTRKPVLLDYSDEWTTENIEFIIRPRFRKKIEKFLEKIFLRASTFVAFSTESSKILYEKKYPEFAHKFRVILNGFDEDDFKDVVPHKSGNKLVMVYTGSVDCRDEPNEYSYIPSLNGLFSALFLLKEEIGNLEKEIRVRFVGAYDENLKNLISKFSLNDIVAISGYKSHKEAIREILSADVLILFNYAAEHGKRVLPGKLFEYIRARNPILAIVPKQCEISRLVELYNAGVVVEPDDIDGIKKAIIGFIRMKHEGELEKWRFSDEPLERIERRSSTKKLVEIIEEKVKN